MSADTFSRIAGTYAQFRPRYPRELFDALASLAPQRTLAWDCATGSGQAASELVNVVERVVATDRSTELLAQAAPHPRIEYRVADALASGLEDHSVGLITVANALHWFAGPAFEREARRVAVAGGVVAAWGLSIQSITPPLDAVLTRLHDELLRPFWLDANWIVHEGYRRLPFDFERLPPPPIAMHTSARLDELLGYLRTWSAVVKYREARGLDPVSLVEAELREHWGAEERRTVHWRLGLVVGRV
ncbi:MAG: methyltransferase domain-containing protein [Archangium sp.]